MVRHVLVLIGLLAVVGVVMAGRRRGYKPARRGKDRCGRRGHVCDDNASCVSSSRSKAAFYCLCNPGYSGNGYTCTDIDECATNTDNCHCHATCNNTVGGFTCTCNEGFAGNGVSNCTNIKDCASSSCPASHVCTDGIASFTCSCLNDPQGLTDPTVNLALTKPAFQSSLFAAVSPISTTADKGVDGNFDPSFHGNSCTHTNQERAWFVVDLQAEYLISRVILTNRNAVPERLADFSIVVGNTFNPGTATADSISAGLLCANLTAAVGTAETRSFQCPACLKGRYVSVVYNPGKVDYLTLCEMQVFGTNSSFPWPPAI